MIFCSILMKENLSVGLNTYRTYTAHWEQETLHRKFIPFTFGVLGCHCAIWGLHTSIFNIELYIAYMQASMHNPWMHVSRSHHPIILMLVYKLQNTVRACMQINHITQLSPIDLWCRKWKFTFSVWVNKVFEVGKKTRRFSSREDCGKLWAVERIVVNCDHCMTGYFLYVSFKAQYVYA